MPHNFYLGDLQVILFEGWMLGFEPIDAKAAEDIDPQVSPYNL